MGGRSRAAAQMLSGMGFGEVYNLKGGMKAWQGLKAEGPIEMGMMYVRGDETPEDIITLAYGMEDGLGDFYASMADLTRDEEVKAVLKSLSQIEDKHKKKLYELYLDLQPETKDRDAFESAIAPDVMEGGFSTKDFIEAHRSDMETVEGVIIVAMMLETQALDLYLRYSHQTKDENTKGILQNIGDEEKAHLEKLGRLMEEKHGHSNLI